MNDIFSENKEQFNPLLKACGSKKKEESLAATAEIAKAIELPLRKGILAGDILDGIFEPIVFEKGAVPEWPLDLLAPGSEIDHVAYTLPNNGYIPQRHVEGDYIMVPTYDIGSAIDWSLKYARDARWDIVKRAIEVFRAGFVKKMNDDGWHVLLTAAVDRNIIVLDSDASAGQFTKRVVSLSKTVMRRNGGGNSSSANRGKLTDMYLSPEGMEDIRNWNVDQVDEVTRREIFTSPEGLTKIFQVLLHDLDELGEGQEYQLYFQNTLGASVPTGDLEIGVGLDLTKRDSFVMPIVDELQVFEDDVLHRQRRAGVYGWQEQGVGSLDNRRLLLFSF
jgi:hypothetical protein